DGGFVADADLPCDLGAGPDQDVVADPGSAARGRDRHAFGELAVAADVRGGRDANRADFTEPEPAADLRLGGQRDSAQSAEKEVDRLVRADDGKAQDAGQPPQGAADAIRD